MKRKPQLKGDKDRPGAKSVACSRVSMDTARTIIKQVCEQDPEASVKMVISYDSDGFIQTRNFVIASTIAPDQGPGGGWHRS